MCCEFRAVWLTKMEASMKGSGSKGSEKEMELYITLMVMFFKDFGRMI
jgi:hypothetical protein